MDPYTQSFIVIAELDRRYREYRDVGWVYIMRNPAFREALFKIGKSSRPPMLRAAELGAATSVPVGFEVLHFIHASDHHAAEALAHRELQPYRRARNKEFFDAPLSLAVQTLERIASQYPVVIGPKKAPRVLPQPFQPIEFLCPHCRAKNRVRPLLISITVKCGACKAGVEVAAG